MLITIPNELIIKISSYCSMKDIYNISHVCKITARLRLYRLYMSSLSCSRFCGTTSYNNLQVEFNDLFNFFLRNNTNQINYSIGEYISDLHSLLFNNNNFITSTTDYVYYKPKKFTLEYNHSRRLIDMLNDNYILTKTNRDEDNIIRVYKKCHNVFRVCSLAYHKLRKNHLSVLALIY